MSVADSSRATEGGETEASARRAVAAAGVLTSGASGRAALATLGILGLLPIGEGVLSLEIVVAVAAT
jgi:hypothetical protein